MIRTFKYLMLAFFALAVMAVSAQSAKRMVRQGNKSFEQNNYSDAEVKYKKALEKKPDYVKGKFNLGDAYYQEKDYKDADSLFSEVAATAKSSEVRAKAWYNKGNSLLAQKKYQESIEAYKNALRLNPNDTAAKYNLEYARKKLKKQQQQQKQQQKKNKQNKDKNKKNKDKQKQDQNKDKNKEKKNKKDQQKKEQQKKDQKNKEQQKKQDQQQKQQQNQDKEKGKKGDQKRQKQQPGPQQISKQDAKRMLDALKNGEKKTLQKLQLQKAKAAHHKTKEIDW